MKGKVEQSEGDRIDSPVSGKLTSLGGLVERFFVCVETLVLGEGVGRVVNGLHLLLLDVVVRGSHAVLWL